MMILGAPSLPKATPLRASADVHAEPPAPIGRPPRVDEDLRKSPRTAAAGPSVRARGAETARPSRLAPGPVAVAGKPSTLPARPAFAVPRIGEAAVLLRPRKTTRLCVALHPDRLGEVVIELSLRGGMLRGVVLAESEAARDVISAHLDRLRSDLERKGIRVGELAVIVAGHEEPEGDLPSALRCSRLDLLA